MLVTIAAWIVVFSAVISLAVLEYMHRQAGNHAHAFLLFVIRLFIYAMISPYLMLMVLTFDAGYYIFAKIVNNVRIKINFEEKSSAQ